MLTDTELLTLTKSRIKREEGLVLHAYGDSKGYRTIGYGHLVKPNDKVGNIITLSEAEEMFELDFNIALDSAHRNPAYPKVDLIRRSALIDIAFNMGGDWWRGFPGCTAALVANDYLKAAEELIYNNVSLKTPTGYYRDVPQRAMRNYKLFALGKEEDLRAYC